MQIIDYKSTLYFTYMFHVFNVQLCVEEIIFNLILRASVLAKNQLFQ